MSPTSVQKEAIWGKQEEGLKASRLITLSSFTGKWYLTVQPEFVRLPKIQPRFARQPGSPHGFRLCVRRRCLRLRELRLDLYAAYACYDVLARPRVSSRSPHPDTPYAPSPLDAGRCRLPGLLRGLGAGADRRPLQRCNDCPEQQLQHSFWCGGGCKRRRLRRRFREQ